MSSILTNNGAMVALQTLKGINANLSKTQDEISTGKNVATAKDNAGVWATAKVLESDVSGFKALSNGLSVASSAVSTARGGAEKITDLLNKMRDSIVAAQNDTADRTKLQADIVQMRDQITTVVESAQFNGLNLLDASVTGTFDVVSSLSRTGSTTTTGTIQVTPEDLTAATLGIAAIDVSTAAGATTALAAIDTALQTSIDAAASFGSAGKRLELQNQFLSELQDSLKSGIGVLVDADMEEASARLQALQTQQQLGVQALSIANQAPQSILSLFK
ncbi:flagellin [Paracoccus sp. (in: a-proteobacteria)]|uniref:flagellin N-terminal helical domain-containing protein n=1 Tax=Paracoccus sp. TaxID=267 RepID=UPI00321F7045